MTIVGIRLNIIGKKPYPFYRGVVERGLESLGNSFGSLKKRIYDMEIKLIISNKKQFLDLLLLADEQENMVDKYIDRGIMYVLDDEGIIKAECIITDEQNGVLEIKNLAVKPEYQRNGYGKVMIDFIIKNYKEKYSILQVGTGDSTLTIPFYEQCGFIRSHYIKNFFIDNYEQPIYEDGIQLIDMIYLQRKLK